MALWRAGRSYRTDVGDFQLQAGDAILMVGALGRIRLLAAEPGYIVLNGTVSATAPAPAKARIAALITILVVLLAALNLGWRDQGRQCHPIIG